MDNETNLSSRSEEICWKLAFPLSVQKTIREAGGFIDVYHNLDDIRRWSRDPKTYPKRFRKTTIFFWKTYNNERFYIWAASWDNRAKEFLPYIFKLDSLMVAVIDHRAP